MENLISFLQAVIDSVTEHIVVIDRDGAILFCNRRWCDFGRENNCMITEWVGVNYFNYFGQNINKVDNDAIIGIKKVIEGKQDSFNFEYPCHSPDKQRWFMMRVTPLQMEGESYFVISHHNITDRKLAEEEASRLAITDGLTDISNRRHLDSFLKDEWNRCQRLKISLTLGIIDLDNFKLLNDTYGHQAGDECLRKVADILKLHVHRPTDISARYGGDEFVVVLGNVELEQSSVIFDKILTDIRKIKISNIDIPGKPTITASIGVARVQPDRHEDEKELLIAADKLLYLSKEGGGDSLTTRQYS